MSSKEDVDILGEMDEPSEEDLYSCIKMGVDQGIDAERTKWHTRVELLAMEHARAQEIPATGGHLQYTHGYIEGLRVALQIMHGTKK